MSDHKFRIKLIYQFLDPLALKADKRAFGREIKLLKDLMAKYDDESFWLNMGVGFNLNSLAWFKTKDGSAILDAKWNMYQMELVQQKEINKKLLDSALNKTKIDSNVPEEKIISPKKENVIDWVDSN